MLDRQPLGGFEGGTGGRRLGDVEVIDLGYLGSGRQQCVGCRLACRVGERADSERSIERRAVLNTKLRASRWFL